MKEMKAKTLKYKPAFLILLLALLITYACTRVENDSRSGSLLTIDSVTGQVGDKNGNFQDSTPLLSDTCDNDNSQPQDPDLCTVVNDNAIITFSNQLLLGGTSGTAFQDIIVNRYRVDYFRPNGRNVPGVDVPYGIDGTMNVRVVAGGSSTGTIVIVRHEAKREPPLAELDNGQSEDVLTANAQIRCFGQDVAGHTVSATGYLEIHFANYGERQ
jgi:hypothetical protein